MASDTASDAAKQQSGQEFHVMTSYHHALLGYVHSLQSSKHSRAIAVSLAVALLTGHSAACPVKKGTIAAGRIPAIKTLVPVCSKGNLESEISILKGLGKDIITGNFVETYHIYTDEGYPALLKAAKQFESDVQKAGFTGRQWKDTGWGKLVDFEYPNDAFSYLRIVYVTARGGSVAVFVMGMK